MDNLALLEVQPDQLYRDCPLFGKDDEIDCKPTIASILKKHLVEFDYNYCQPEEN